jgi:hypothetical protein
MNLENSLLIEKLESDCLLKSLTRPVQPKSSTISQAHDKKAPGATTHRKVARQVLLNVVNVCSHVSATIPRIANDYAQQPTSHHLMHSEHTGIEQRDAPLSLAARGSVTSMPISFQSVSPSSIMANTPRILTCFTSPIAATAQKGSDAAGQQGGVGGPGRVRGGGEEEIKGASLKHHTATDSSRRCRRCQSGRCRPWRLCACPRGSGSPRSAGFEHATRKHMHVSAALQQTVFTRRKKSHLIQTLTPGGWRHSSRCSRGEGSSCGQSGGHPSSHLAGWG